MHVATALAHPNDEKSRGTDSGKMMMIVTARTRIVRSSGSAYSSKKGSKMSPMTIKSAKAGVAIQTVGAAAARGSRIQTGWRTSDACAEATHEGAQVEDVPAKAAQRFVGEILERVHPWCKL